MQRLYALNPLVGLIDGFRAALLGGRFNQFALAVSVSVTIILLLISAYVFNRFEDDLLTSFKRVTATTFAGSDKSDEQ